jgi:hypothetical protein
VSGARKRLPWPLMITACADCGVGTIGLGEWYHLKRDLWEQAWHGRRKPWQHSPGQEVLCIACLEKRPIMPPSGGLPIK